MTPERWLKAKELFCQALECEPSRRNAFLEQACADDQELLLEVESLLSAVEDSQLLFNQPAVDLLGLNGLKLGEFLEADELAPASGPADRDLLLPETPKSKSALIGQQIGNYRLTKLIGRGGMGAVFLAVRADDDYDHEVAVKIVARPALTREVLRRFRTERQILARLDHPNIAKLFDGGTTPDGLPYFVMEYIEGEPITSYCDNRQLSIPERLRLFLKVCAAVQYAHQNLVIHRDIKPSNILVTAEGIPKLLDFGIAKVLTPRTSAVQTLETTQFGVLALTPRYASPEQVRGETVTTVSDVYSLGVLLYELLTGVPPYEFPQMVPAEIERVVCLVEPPRPGDVVRDRKKAKVEAFVEVEPGQSLASAKTALERSTARGTTPEKLRLQLLGDLDTIVLTALRKEPERRYPLVAKLAEDLERYLTGLPVLARGDTVRYRFGKYVRRNKLAVAATVLVVVSLVGGTGVSLWQARRANQERIKAEQAQARAEQRFNDVRHLAKKILFEIHDKIENLPGSTEARKMIVEESLKYLDSLSKEVTNDPELQMELAINYRKVGDVQGRPYSANLGDINGAILSYRKSIELFEILVSKGDRLEISHYNSSISFDRLAKVYLSLNNQSQAQYNFDKAEAHLSVAYSLNRDNFEYQKQLALGNFQQGLISEANGDLINAFDNYLKAYTLTKKLWEENPQDNVLHRRKIAMGQYLAVNYKQIGDFLAEKMKNLDSANYFYNQGVSLLQSELQEAQILLNNDLRNVLILTDISSLYLTIAQVLEKQKKLQVALSNYHNSIKITEQLVKDDPSSIEFQVQLAASNQYIGYCYYLASDYFKSAQAYDKATQLLNHIGKNESNSDRVRFIQSEILYNQGVLANAQQRITVEIDKFNQSRLLLKELLRTNPKNGDFGRAYAKVIFEISHSFLQNGRRQDALDKVNELFQWYGEQITESIVEPWVYEQYGWALLNCPLPEKRNIAYGKKMAEQAVKLTNNRNLVALFTLADASCKERNAASQMEILRQISSILPCPKELKQSLDQTKFDCWEDK